MSEVSKIQNKEMLLYSAEKSIKAVCKLGADNASDEDAYYVIGTAIHWTMDCIDRLPKSIREGSTKFTGLGFANNCLKHNTTFEKAHASKGHSYPFEYPYDYGTHYIWTSLDNVKIRGKKNERESYKEELEGKNVYVTLKDIFEEVKNYYSDY